MTDIQHRNFGWKPLNEPDTTPEWVSKTLIPQLNIATGLEWWIAGNRLLHSEKTSIFLPISSMWDKLGGVFEKNLAPQEVKKLYPVVKEDDLGYKLEKRIHPKDRPRQHIAYEGFWSLSVDRILERGKITGEKFGL
jgi:hypothetical protein